MTSPTANSTIGVLASGGLDSCILIAHLLRQGSRVRPFYVRCGLIWEEAELTGLKAFLRAIALSPCPSPKTGEGSDAWTAAGLDELVAFDLPLRDLYGRHWSIDGRDAPDARTPAAAVYLPGRNALLTIKPAIWCGRRGVDRLALALLAGNPFPDATDEFFRGLETTLETATGNRVRILRPFAGMDKTEVLRLGRGLPLELTFSCLSPDSGLHCGRCNKCAERREAFRSLEMDDPTRYANREDNNP